MHNVLLVDDSEFMRQWYRAALERNNIEVAGEAANGFEAIARYKEQNPSIVIMDLNMPGLSGLDAMKEILKYDPDAKIIMSSAMGQEAFVQRSVRSGASAFIVKPIIERMLIDTILRVLL